MSVAIAELRRRVAIEAASDVPDGAGGVTRTFVPVDEVFARITPRRRRETVQAGRQVGVVTHRITMRWRDDIAGDMRLVCDGATYRVLVAEDADPMRRFIDCWCEEEKA